MDRHRAALTRLAGFLDGLRTPIDGWQVALQMQQIAREALGAEHVEFPELSREMTCGWCHEPGLKPGHVHFCPTFPN